MNSGTLQALLRDAEALAEHALRHGCIPPGSKVFELIEALEAEPPPDDATARIAQLYAEVDALAKAIPRPTLAWLAWRGEMRGYLARFLAGFAPFAIGFLTLMLTLYLAFQSSQLHQADTALRAYYEWVEQQPREKLYAAFKMYRYERVLNVTQPPLAQLDAYQKLVEDAHQLANKGAAIQSLLQRASNLLYVPRFLEESGPEGYRAFFNRLNAGDLPMVLPTALPEVKWGGTDPNTRPQMPWLGEAVPALPGETIQCRPEDEVLPPAKPVVRTAARPVREDAASYERGWYCFLKRIKLDEKQLNYSPWPVIYDTKIKLNMLVSWLLPGLYGLLGACVYLLRDLIVARNKRIDSDNSVLTTLSLLLRIALGGLAGIIIGWFWVPTPGAGGLPQISSIPFGIAFLAGFSIETLFSLLDRLNKGIANPPEPQKQNGAPAHT